MSAEFSLDWDGWEKLEYFLDGGSSSFLICKEPESCRGTHTCSGLLHYCPYRQQPLSPQLREFNGQGKMVEGLDFIHLNL